MQMLPVQVSEGVQIVSIATRLLPWRAPAVMGLLGHSISDPDDRQMLIANEWPISWMRTVDPIPQDQQELLHVARFRTDHLLGTGVPPFAGVMKGNDPPDMQATTVDGVLGLECMTLTISARRQAQALFRNVRQLVMQQDPAAFQALAGHIVHMWFNDEDSALARPHARSDHDAAIQLVQALAQYRPNTESLTRWRGELPLEAPELPLHKTDAGASFYCTPIFFATPATALFSIAGFELSLAYTTQHSLKAEWDSLKAKIAKKDRAGNDWLLISAGALDQRGDLYQSEDDLADFLLGQPQPLNGLNHLKRVTIHMWNTGTAVDLWPEFRHLFGPIYSGTLPLHQPIAEPSAAQADGSPAPLGDQQTA